MGSAGFKLLSLVLCLGLLSTHTTLSSAAVYYVTPHSPNPDCPSGEPCFTIDEYAQGSYFSGDIKITLRFLNGEHNLTKQNLEINDKTSLKMAPSNTRPDVVVQFQNRTTITLRNILLMEISGLNFSSQTDHLIYQAAGYINTPDCLSIVDIGLLSVTTVSIMVCTLSLGGDLEATITGVNASWSYIIISSDENNDIAIVIRNSEFHLSTLVIRDNPVSYIFAGDIRKNALILEHVSMKTSLLLVQLQKPTLYSLTITNTSFISQHQDYSETGIIIEVRKTCTLFLFIKNCSIVENYQSIVVTASGNSHVELNVHQCYIARNGEVTNRVTGGIFVTIVDDSTAVAIVNITSTNLTENNDAQIHLIGNSGTTVVNIFDSTLSGTKQMIDEVKEIGGIFETGNKSMFINLTQTIFDNNGIGVSIVGGAFDFHFVSNTVRLSALDLPTVYPVVGPGMSIEGRGNSSYVRIDKCIFSHYTRYAAILFRGSVKVIITQTVIENSHNGLLIDTSYEPTILSMVVTDCHLKENTGVSLGVENLQPFCLTPNDIKVKRVNFSRNSNNFPNTGIIQVDRSISLSVEDGCVFRDNYGSVIQAFMTTVSLSGVIMFEKNTAFQGGAISLNWSILRLVSLQNTNSNILFLNNTVNSKGGSIYIEHSFKKDTQVTGSACFYEIQGVSNDQLYRSAIKMTFINNTAVKGGFDVYGATPISQCLIDIKEADPKPSSSIQDYIFKTSPGISSISSDPKRVCLCFLSQLQCANLSYIVYNITRYPGEMFSLSLAVVGFEFGTVTGPVYANLLPQVNNSRSSLGSDQHERQVTYNGCSQLNFTVNSLKSMETIVLTINNTRITNADNFRNIKSTIQEYNWYVPHMIPFFLLTVPVYINVAFLDCPGGFKLTETGRCECVMLKGSPFEYNCSIYNNRSYIQVTRSENQWIQLKFNRVILSNNCPFNYCKQETMNFNLLEPDKQCALNRTGTLCGACPSHLSLAIGSSRCVKCSNNYYTLLLIVFAAAGVLLVLFIKVLDMTVTTGTINGLIFYANIVWANQSVLFPPQAETYTPLQFFKMFIAWLNLDFGIEICFIQHLDGYQKTWLQFAFPAYIWLIAGLIIVIAHYSTRATRILGKNSLSVLSTLFLLSYAKLLRTILIVFDYTITEEYPQGQKTAKWSFDGKVEYFDQKHRILFIAALVILLVLWLPFTLVLLVIQCLRRHTHYCLLRWVDKLKPLFDSYLGPLKDKHHYWIGLGLLARLVLLLAPIVTLDTMPYIAPLMIALTATVLCLLVLSVYKQWQLSVLEGCFLVNLASFSCGILYIKAVGASKHALAYTSLGIAFFLFIVIIGYHIWRAVSLLKNQRRNTLNGYEEIDNTQTPPQVPPPNETTTYQEVAVPQLRESLLESESNY